MAEHATTTSAVDGEPILDYLGWPCKIAEAFEGFDDAVDDARKLTTQQLTRSIGCNIAELSAHDEHIGNALRLALEALPGSTDDDHVRALLSMAIPYWNTGSNVLFRLVGEMLAALERGGLLEAKLAEHVKAESAEAAHA